MTEQERKPAKPDPSAHHEIGDDKGEGGEKDIKTDSVEASHTGDKGQVQQG